MIDLTATISHLERQLRSVGEILACLESQQDAIQRRDVPAVMNSVFALQGEIARRERLDRERAEILHHMAQRLDINPEEVTLQSLLAVAAPEDAAIAEGHSTALRHLLEECSRRYRLNRELLHQELSFVEHMLEALGEPQRSGAYAKTGSLSSAEQKSTGIVDVKG